MRKFRKSHTETTVYGRTLWNGFVLYYGDTSGLCSRVFACTSYEVHCLLHLFCFCDVLTAGWLFAVGTCRDFLSTSQEAASCFCAACALGPRYLPIIGSFWYVSWVRVFFVFRYHPLSCLWFSPRFSWVVNVTHSPIMIAQGLLFLAMIAIAAFLRTRGIRSGVDV